MIRFEKLWITLKERNISQYRLVREYGVSTGQLDRLRKNGNVSTFTLNRLCEILDCRLEDIAEYVPDTQQR
jgi:putative transcriptional regulator